jgi:signal peptidase I
MSREKYIEKLLNGETVTMRDCGGSMTPIMKTGDSIIIEPITDHNKIKEGDAVFCHVAGMLTVHKVTGKRVRKETLEFQISNNHKHVNGWTPSHKVYGKFTRVEKRK